MQGVIALIRGEPLGVHQRDGALSSGIETLKQAGMYRQHRDVNTDPQTMGQHTTGDAERVLERLVIEACKYSSQLRRTCHRQVVKKQIMAIRNCK